MKNKIVIASLLIVSILAAGCKKKEEPTQKNQVQTIAFYAGDTATISTFDGKATDYTSADEFIAAVDNGKAIAKHVGTTRLVASDTLYSADVTVLPRYRFFQEPVKDWGIDTTELIERVAPLRPVRPFGLDSAGVRTMIGVINMINIQATLYYFENNQLTLTWSLIPQKDSVLTHMEDFLTERYEYMNSYVEQSFWSDATIHRYMDAYSPRNAQLIVGYHDMILDEASFMIESMFGTRNLLGLLYQDAQLHQIDTAWIENYINGLPSRLTGNQQ